MKKYLILLLTFIMSSAYSQHRLLFENYNIEQGLSQSNVRCIIQDKQGFLWLGTQEGLNRFDGYNFLVFKNIAGDTTSLSANYINSIVEDKNGNIWVGTDGGGICKYDPLTSTFSKFSRDIDKNDISTVLTVYKDSKNEIWAGTYLRGLIKYNPDKNAFESYTHLKNINPGTIISIYEDKQGKFWLGSLDAGLILFDKSKKILKCFTKKDGLPSDFVCSIVENNKGELVIGTDAGVSIFNKKDKFLNHYHDPTNAASLSSNKIRTIFCDKRGNTFIGTEDAGLNCLFIGDNYFYKYKMEDKSYPLSDNNVYSVYEDNSNIIWVGTNRGLNKIKATKNFISEKISGKNNSLNVKAIYEDSYNNMWIGSDYGLYKSYPTSGNLLNKKIERISGVIENKVVWAISSDRSGNIWAATSSGLYCIERVTNKVKAFKPHEPKDTYLYNVIRSIYIDDSLLWAGTYGRGIIKFNLKQKEYNPFNPAKGDPGLLAAETIHKIYKDRSGYLWFCTSNGLFKYSPAEDSLSSCFKVKTEDDTNPFNESLCIYEAKNCFWIGTFGGGIIKFIPGRGIVKRYFEQQGLSNNIVYAILPDDSGNLWLSTNRGISKFHIKTESFRNYNISDGLPSDEFNVGAYFKGGSGKLYFGSIKGLVSFDPELIRDNKYIPQVAITGFKVFDKPFFKKLIFEDKDTIDLAYKHNFFSFEFAALDYTESIKNKFAYMLEGYDPDWIISGKRRYAAYTNLDPGTYIFRVRASNNDEAWNNKGISLWVIISPPFWQTWWFRIFSAVIIMGGVFILIKRRINNLEEEKEAQQRYSKQLIDAQENERMRIASELHDSIGQSLIIIKNRAAFGVDYTTSQLKNEQLEQIVDISTQTIREVKEISYNLRPYQLGKLGLTRAIEAVIKNTCSISSMKFIIRIDNIDNLLPVDHEIHFYRIVQECLNNTIKHSKATEVKINIVKKERHFLFNYKDNGVGYNKEANKQGKHREGMGLTGISERVKILDGVLNLETGLGKGVKINIQVQTGKM